jgi:hypothetical protein
MRLSTLSGAVKPLAFTAILARNPIERGFSWGMRRQPAGYGGQQPAKTSK